MVETTTPFTLTSRSSLLRKNLVFVKESEAYSIFETTFVVGRVYSEAQIIQEQVESGTRLTVLTVFRSPSTNLKDITGPYMTRIDLAARHRFIFTKSGETLDIGRVGAQDYVELQECDPILQDARFKTPTEIYVFFEDRDCFLVSGDPVFSFQGRFHLLPRFGSEYESESDYYASESDGASPEYADTSSGDPCSPASDEVERSDTSAAPDQGGNDEGKNLDQVATTSSSSSNLEAEILHTIAEPAPGNIQHHFGGSSGDGQLTIEANQDLDLPILIVTSTDQTPFISADLDNGRSDDVNSLTALQGLSTEALRAHSAALGANANVMFL
ncbi:hypothetical protein K443DRAFT_676435 [Laccaria amethystina LaAM-08-1]|uniref:Uncharacterized protein n=1 Tax=Laccaria amethystina LaAM-08-1 TaxID=1095629 RepID=A0A0C9Y6T6_9AGAR|nr:hypothetical protein K443DRAFT_676435 [Laccaria amethystina LaAM-08-1]